MDPWLSPFSDIGVGLLLALVDDKGVRDRIENGFSLFGARAAMLAKGLEGASLSCLLALALICFVLLLSYKTFISTY